MKVKAQIYFDTSSREVFINADGMDYVIGVYNGGGYYSCLDIKTPLEIADMQAKIKKIDEEARAKDAQRSNEVRPKGWLRRKLGI